VLAMEIVMRAGLRCVLRSGGVQAWNIVIRSTRAQPAQARH
jgi:hypothetical protein